MSALSPPRLVWGLLTLVVMIAVGRVADLAYRALGGPPVSPSGLAVGAWSDDQRASARRSAVSAVASFATGTTLGEQLVATESTPSELRAIVDGAFLERVAKAKGAAASSLYVRYHQIQSSIDALRPRGPAEALGAELASSLRTLGGAVLGLAPLVALDAALDGLLRAPAALVRFAPWFALLAGVPMLALVSVLGGGLCRMTAWDAGRSVKLPLVDAAMFVRRAMVRLALVPIFPVGVVGVSLVLMATVGALMRVPVLDLVGGLLYGAVLVLSFLIAVGGVCFVVTWPLAIASVAAGDGDSVDAVVRSNAYLLRKPGMAVLALASAIVAVALGLAIAGGAALLTLNLAETAVGFWGGSGAALAAGDAGLLTPAFGAPPLGSGTARAAGAFVDLWELITVLLVGGAAVSLIADAATRAYLVLRCACDGQDPSDIDGVPLGRAKID